MIKFRTHYDNLNVTQNAPIAVIKSAYKTLSQSYHPDKYRGKHEQAHRIMKIINKAYAVLSDPIKRAEHDQWISRKTNEISLDNSRALKEKPMDIHHGFSWNRDSVSNAEVCNLYQSRININTQLHTWVA